MKTAAASATKDGIDLMLGSSINAVERSDPAYLEMFRELARVPYERGALGPKVRELIHVALNGSVSHLNEQALRTHIGAALDAGATKTEIVEVLQLISVLGVHGGIMGTDILFEEAQKAGKFDESRLPWSANDREAFKSEFAATRGFWSSAWDTMLLLSPRMLRAYMNFSAHPWRNGCLKPKVREFIYIAIDASTNHLHQLGTRQHIVNAFRHGASVAEIMEIMELATLMGVQSVAVGVPILLEELRARTNDLQ